MKYSLLILTFMLMAYAKTLAGLDPFVEYQPILPNAIKSKFEPTRLINLQGLLGHRVNINLEKRLLNIDSAILLSGFKKRPGTQVWIGEHVGKFLFSASLTYRYSRDARLKKLMDEMVTKYIATQLPNGYIGTYLPADYWSEWDVWAHKYCIIGLLNYYQVTGDKRALQTASKAADLICTTFGDQPGQADLMKSGHHVGMASGSILEPMIDLYRYTGNVKYLQFAQYILRAWEQDNGPKIISNLEKYGKVTKVGNAKAYEMMSCLVGIAKYYTLTGEEKYYKALQTAWNDIRLNRLYITGTASSYEHFKEDNILPADNDAHMGEGCVTTTWIQYCYQMLCISGEVKYAEEIERAVYNHLTAAENPVTGCVSYYTALQGKKPHKCDQGYSCCLSSIPRGISMIPDMVIGKIHGNLSVLMYESGACTDTIVAADGEKISLFLKSDSKFPHDGILNYTISISNPKKFTLNFRVPAWSSNFKVMTNGETISGKSGTLLPISRTWKQNDKVVISFDIATQVIPGGKSYPNHVAIKRGPQVLAFDASLNAYNGTVNEVSSTNFDITLTDASSTLPNDWSWKQAYTAELNINGKSQKVTLVPFAEAGQNASEVGVWLQMPKLNVK
ncbi:MAG: glycoside hydrolase family 127 protein [Cytophagales bacterium]|nr:glycoside hydrolase family 127 protein [Cytophagales bacterium]